MNPTSRFPKVISLCLLLFPLLVTGAWAQLEIRPVSPFNALTYGTAFGSTNPVPRSQFSSVGITSGGAAVGAKAEYKNAQGVVIPASTLNLTTAQIGNSFSNGVPRYYLGDVITPPLTQAKCAQPSGKKARQP